MYLTLGNLLLLAASWVHVLAIQKVTRQGRYLYTDDQNRFYIKGVAYQEQGYSRSDAIDFYLSDI